LVSLQWPPSLSLPDFDVQAHCSRASDRSRPICLTTKISTNSSPEKFWPLLAAKREELAQCYEPENGRPGIEPVVLLGVLIFQFLERIPDRQAAELVKYHLGWKLALNLKLGAEGFHPTTSVNFRQRLLEAGKSDLAASRSLKPPWIPASRGPPFMRLGKTSTRKA